MTDTEVKRPIRRMVGWRRPIRTDQGRQTEGIQGSGKRIGEKLCRETLAGCTVCVMVWVTDEKLG